MAKNFRVYAFTGDSEFSPVRFETVEGSAVESNVLPHIKSLSMDVSNLDTDEKVLLCNALREAAAFIERGTHELASTAPRGRELVGRRNERWVLARSQPH